MSRRTLILANLGTPREPTPDAVREFLREFLSDRNVVDWPVWLWQPVLRGIVLRRRPIRVAHAYRAVWRPAGSPLHDDTLRIVADVAARVGPDWDVVPAYRYGDPGLARVAADRLSAGDAEVVVVPLFPHRTSSSSGTLVDLAQAVAREHPGGARLRVAEIPPDAPGFIDALADRVRAGAAAIDAEHLLLSFHGIPARYDRREGGRYPRDCRATTDALLAALGWPAERATLAFQSRFGPERWIGPSTSGEIAALARRGIRRLAVATPGFLTDGLETLEEIGIRGRDTFLAAGGESFVAIPAPAGHPRLADALAGLVLPGIPSIA